MCGEFLTRVFSEKQINAVLVETLDILSLYLLMVPDLKVLKEAPACFLAELIKKSEIFLCFI